MEEKRTSETPQGWLGKIASDTATQSLSRGDRRVGPQVIGED